MPEQVRCPSCNAALRIPDHLLGKNVKCPKCQETFIAESEQPDELEEVEPERPAPAARRRPRPPEDREEEDYPPEEELEEEEEERPRRRRRGRRRLDEARAAVAGPAMSLIVLGGFDIFLVVLNLILSLAGVNFAPAPARGPGAPPAPNLDFLSRPAAVIPQALLGLCFATAILMGGIKMRQLQSYGLAMTASILAMLPCGNCCCIGLFLGIWALVVLNRPGVKDSFS